MGAHTYCSKCDAPLGKPAIREIVDGERMCPHCGTLLLISTDTVADILEDFEERLKALEG